MRARIAWSARVRDVWRRRRRRRRRRVRARNCVIDVLALRAKQNKRLKGFVARRRRVRIVDRVD